MKMYICCYKHEDDMSCYKYEDAYLLL